MTIICLCVPSDTIISGWQKGVRNDHNLSPHVIGLSASGWRKAQNDHNLSLRAIGHDRLWMAKRCGMTIVCLRMSSSSPPLADKRVQNDHNLSLCAIGHDRLRMAKRCGMTIICLRMSHDLRVSMTEIVGRLTKARLLLLHILNEELRPT